MKKKDTKRGSQLIFWGEFSDALAVFSEEKHSLFQRDDVFVAGVLPGEPQSQVVGFGPESTKGAKVTLSYSVTTKHTHVEVQPVREPLDFAQQKDWDTRIKYGCRPAAAATLAQTKPSSYKYKKQLLLLFTEIKMRLSRHVSVQWILFSFASPQTHFIRGHLP